MEPDIITVSNPQYRSSGLEYDLSSVELERAVNSLRGNRIQSESRVSNKSNMKKQRHYNQDERFEKHNPASDWRECKRGEKCYNAASLEVEDIVSKHLRTQATAG